MQRIKQAFYGIICLMFIVSCNDTNDTQVAGTTDDKSPTNFDIGAVKTTIESNNKKFGDAMANGDSAALATLYTSDAKVMPEGSPSLTGSDNIKSMWGEIMRMGLSGKLQTTDIWGNEEIVAEEGTYVFNDKDGKEVDKGKYLVLWKKENGEWKIFRDIWNSDGHAK